jgi:fructose/tagatose bisphosphate aldolase
MGQISFKPGCTIVLQGVEKFDTPTNYAGIYIDDSKLYNLIRSYPIPNNLTIKKMVEEQILSQILHCNKYPCQVILHSDHNTHNHTHRVAEETSETSHMYYL